MRAKNTCRRLFVGLLLWFFTSVPTVIIADSGGGPSSPISPYSRQERVDTVTVMQTKQQLSQEMCIYDIPVTDKPSVTVGMDVGLAYLGDGQNEWEVHFAFLGTDEHGNNIEVDFGEIESFTILKREGDTVSIRVDRFPAITPEDLVLNKPSYVELREKYGMTIDLHVELKDGEGGILYFVEYDHDKGGVYSRIVPVKDIEHGQRIRFHSPHNLYWWAVPSVANDPAFPYRITIKK